MNDNKVKICPLAWSQPCERDRICNCQEELCAWYVPPQHTRDDGHCAVRDLSMLPHVAREVSKL